MFVIQIYLPLRSNSGKPFLKHKYDQITSNLTKEFGGVTAYLRAPADGAWQDNDGSEKHDDIVVYEVLAESINREWWNATRTNWEQEFQQEEIIIRAHEVSML